MSATPGIIALAPPRKRDSHIWEREGNDHYVEPAWCSERVFEVETFQGCINDPCCGFGTIVEAAKRAGFEAHGCDLVDRGYAGTYVEDFLRSAWRRDNIVCNPPFSLAERLVQHALTLTAHKIAIIFPVPRLNAARWLRDTPLRRIWLLTPRPSMPPGYVIKAGGKPQGGKEDYCWLVFEQGFTGHPVTWWLHRDEGKAPPKRS